MAARKKLTTWFLVAALVALSVSVVLAFAIWPLRDTDAALPYAILGYVLTPFAVAAVLVAARARDLGLQGNPLYLRLDGQRLVRKVGLVVGLSFLPAIVHIWCIALYVGSVIA